MTAAIKKPVKREVRFAIQLNTAKIIYSAAAIYQRICTVYGPEKTPLRAIKLSTIGFVPFKVVEQSCMTKLSSGRPRVDDIYQARLFRHFEVNEPNCVKLSH